jgi:hypothetical protein
MHDKAISFLSDNYKLDEQTKIIAKKDLIIESLLDTILKLKS